MRQPAKTKPDTANATQDDPTMHIPRDPIERPPSIETRHAATRALNLNTYYS